MNTTNSNIWVWIVYMVLIFGAMYFMVIRPNKKKKIEEEELRKNLEIGDEITTIGGIVGRIVNIKDDDGDIIIETGVDHNKIKIKRWAVASNISKNKANN